MMLKIERIFAIFGGVRKETLIRVQKCLLFATRHLKSGSK